MVLTGELGPRPSIQDRGIPRGARVQFDESRHLDRTVVEAHQTGGCMDNKLERSRLVVPTILIGGRQYLLLGAQHEVSPRHPARPAIPVHGADGDRRRNR